MAMCGEFSGITPPFGATRRLRTNRKRVECEYGVCVNWANVRIGTISTLVYLCVVDKDEISIKWL